MIDAMKDASVVTLVGARPRKQTHVADSKMADECRPGDPIIVVNGRTGKELQHWVWDPDYAPKESEWIRLFQQSTGPLIENGVLSGEMEYRVMLHIAVKTGYSNSCRIKQGELAREWGMKSHATISRALKSLESKGVVYCTERTNDGNYYRLNPNYAWKGSMKAREAEIADQSRKRIDEHIAHQAVREPVFLCPEKASA